MLQYSIQLEHHFSIELVSGHPLPISQQVVVRVQNSIFPSFHLSLFIIYVAGKARRGNRILPKTSKNKIVMFFVCETKSYRDTGVCETALVRNILTRDGVAHPGMIVFCVDQFLESNMLEELSRCQEFYKFFIDCKQCVHQSIDI